MKACISGVAWKELHTLGARSKDRADLIRLASLLGISGYLAHLAGTEFGVSRLTIAIVAGIAILAALPVAAESIAGEREHHTLETLLASPASVADVVLGKWIGVGVFGAAAALITLTVGLIVRAVETTTLDSVSALTISESVVAALVASGFAAALGVLVSARASSSRSAVQTLSLAMMGAALLPMAFASMLPPNWDANVKGWISRVDSAAMLLAAAAQLAVVTALFLYVACRILPRSAKC